MTISQKCQYALRAVFELALRIGRGPTKIGVIADAQAIPQRFLELILCDLKQGGFVESRRGAQGGYRLVVPPQGLTVGDIIQFVEGPFAPVDCVSSRSQSNCPLEGNCAFMSMWERARDAVADVYHSTTFQDLLDEARASAEKQALNYCI